MKKRIRRTTRKKTRRGFRYRMKTKSGRAMIRKRRREGRAI